MSGSHKKPSGRCPQYPCTQSTLEGYMKRIMTIMVDDGAVHEVFAYHEVVEIIHGCLTIFADEPTLLQFPVPENGLAIIGDLHGDDYCLVRAFEFYGFPPDTSYLFLGDFVDRGPKQNEILLFILLMKLRWPEYVYILRGNHEAIIPNRNEFKERCLKDYNSPHVFPQILQMFDHIPLCAIVSDYFLICHGGISQWMTCRANIMNLKRPTDLDNMTILEGALVADMLWADPDPDQELPFAPSFRGTGYCFSQQALHAVLRALNVQMLIRGHQVNECGVKDNFGDGKCITVHTSIREDYNYTKSGTLKIARDANGEFVIASRVVQIGDTLEGDQVWKGVSQTLNKNLKRNMLNRATPKCQWCRKKIPKNILTRKRWTSPIEAAKWIVDYARYYAEKDRRLGNACKARNDEVVCDRGCKLFPAIYDSFALDGGGANDPCTFRILVSAEEKAFMSCFHTTTRNYGISETLANDVDPRLEDIKRNKQGGLKRSISNVFKHAFCLNDLSS